MSSLDDVRDIKVETGRGDDGFAERDLRAIADKFILRNYRGPIESIRVSTYQSDLVVEVVIFVLDVHSRRPVRLTAQKTYPEAMYVWSTGDGGRIGYIARVIRETIRFATLHEIDECFLFDGRFVENPHPDVPAYDRGSRATYEQLPPASRFDSMPAYIAAMAAVREQRARDGYDLPPRA